MSFSDDFDQLIISESHGGPSGTIIALCFHDAESPETPDGAENVAYYLQPSSRQASVTGCIDSNSKVGCVPYGTTAWHSGAGSPWNGAIEGYEHSGYARQTRDEWLDPYSKAMLEISAAHYAKRCHDLNIPPRKINSDQLIRAIATRNPADGGICGHYDITLAAGVYGGHTDPGPNFPWDYYIDLVRKYHGSVPTPGPTPPPTPTPTIEDHDMNTIIWIETKSGAYVYDPHAGTGRNINPDEVEVLKAAGWPEKRYPAGGAMHRILDSGVRKINYSTVG